jgi:hypothetical protein
LVVSARVLIFRGRVQGQDVSFGVVGEGSAFSLGHELFLPVVTEISSALSLDLVSSDFERTESSRKALRRWKLLVNSEVYYCAAFSNMSLTIQGAK